MKALKSYELRKQYIEFFKERGHAVIPSSSLIPENDPTVLFTTAGMHPLVPYLLGEKHPEGRRLTDVQKCVRTGDIDEVGDATHCTFFEMLGNWSLGDYFKKESITFSFDFLTKVLGIDVDKISVTVFKGDEDAPRDEESADIWNSLGIPRDHIFYLDKKHNWWGPAGITGPCGPDTEIFMDTGKPKCSEHCDPSCDCGKYVEIWNNVFMQYNKTKEGTFEPLKQKNVDTGMGLERTVCMLAGVGSVYETDFFSDVIAMLEEMSGHSYKESESVTKAMRIISDHIRTATFIMGDERGVTPSNVDQGYVLRRLIRRAVRYARVIDLDAKRLIEISDKYVSKYGDVYPELCENKAKVLSELETEIDRFTRTLENGLKELYKVLKYVNGDTLNGKTAFRLYDTYGFPIEMTEELAKEEGYKVDIEGYHKAFEEHQKKSQAGAEQKFKGGLQDNTELTTNLHTATHIMLQSLKRVLGEEVNQKGSNITAERLRFDFNFSRPMTKEEIEKVENMVNDVISKDLTITCEEMTVDEAMKKNAIGVFGSRYGEIVKVYSIGDFDVQICGGPHAERTGILGKFRIVKEQSSSAGVRRIKAVLEK
ncbi:MAG: alanine--tRNA ligase [Clostridia bacterium]|nr:alanine--tRNA ligase [Clostridia bacterium]MCX4366967.1 alanine--tRNA ligase [Clostridia bacterium]